MRIVMLGHSGVGKTTYMASAYGALQSNYEGFSLRAKATSDHERFVTLAKGIAEGTYPAGTDQRETYSFILRFRGHDVLPFDWADYRGGVLMDRSAKAESAKVRNDLAHADGVAIFCDCRKLQRGQRTAQEMGRLSNLLGSSLMGVEKNLPVALVLTKRDCVRDIDERITQWVAPIVECLRSSDRLLGAQIPVACGPKASDVATPLLFLLSHAIQRKSQTLAAEIKQRTQEAEGHEARAATFTGVVKDAWGSFWQGFDPQSYPYRTNTQQAGDARSAAQKAQQALQPLIQPAKALQSRLATITSF